MRAEPRTGWAAEVGPTVRLAWPVVVAELGWMAMGLVDILMVGHLGAEAIGAVGLGNALFMGVTIGGIGLLFGLDTVVSQAFGAGRIDRCHRALVQGVYVALALSPPLMVAVRMGGGRLGGWGVDPGVARTAAPYLAAVSWSVPALLLHTACRRYLQALGATRPVMASLFAANAVNLAANWVLVYGHLGVRALGVEGSGWATTLARCGMALMLAGAVPRHDRGGATGLTRTPLGPDWALLRSLLALGGPAAGQLILEVGVFAAATVLAGRLGAVALAAHEVALNVCGLMFMVPLGISAAGAVRVGQAMGRGDPGGPARAGWAALGLGMAFTTGSALVLTLLPRAILGAFTGESAVIAIGVPLLGLAAMFQLFDGLQVVATGVLRGAGDTRTPMVVGLAAHWAIGLPIAVFLAFPAGRGLFGLWIGLSTGLIVAGLVLLAVWTRWARSQD